MGYISTVLIRNDALGEIEGDPNFGKKLADAIRQKVVNEKMIDVPAGNHGNAAAVVETHYDISYSVVAIGRGHGFVLGYGGSSSEPSDVIEELLRSRIDNGS